MKTASLTVAKLWTLPNTDSVGVYMNDTCKLFPHDSCPRSLAWAYDTNATSMPIEMLKHSKFSLNPSTLSKT